MDPFFRSKEWSPSGIYREATDPQGSPAEIPIVLQYCADCGFIRQSPSHRLRLDYDKIARSTAKQLPDYASDIIASLASLALRQGDAVLEVGCNDGTFLGALRSAGFEALTGVEPSRDLAEAGRAMGHEVICDYFGIRAATSLLRDRAPFRAVICRHTLEHVPDITDLLAGIAQALAPGGVAFIEVPDTDWVISELFAHEIWDEHIGYFRARSLSLALLRHGLTPVRMERQRFRDTRNLLCWAIKAPSDHASATVFPDVTEMVDVSQFQRRWDAFAARLRQQLETAAGPFMAIGAAHNQMNFLNYADLDDRIDVLIDDDPRKAGRYAQLARLVPIKASAEVLAACRRGTLICTGFPYPEWERRLCEALAPRGVTICHPYERRPETEPS